MQAKEIIHDYSSEIVNNFVLLDLFQETKKAKVLKNKRRRIKKIISLNSPNHTISTFIIDNNETITNYNDIADAFNNYFDEAAIGIQFPFRFFFFKLTTTFP